MHVPASRFFSMLEIPHFGSVGITCVINHGNWRYTYMTTYNVGDNVLLITGMLPMSVADDLKQGKPAPATSFQSATVFFRYMPPHESPAPCSQALSLE